MALRDGVPYLAWGSPGGDQQDQWTAQFFLRHVHAGMNLQESIDAQPGTRSTSPLRSGARARPGVLVVEGRFRPRPSGMAPPRPYRRSRRRLDRRTSHSGVTRWPPPPRCGKSRGMQGYAAGGRSQGPSRNSEIMCASPGGQRNVSIWGARLRVRSRCIADPRTFLNRRTSPFRSCTKVSSNLKRYSEQGLELRKGSPTSSIFICMTAEN